MLRLQTAWRRTPAPELAQVDAVHVTVRIAALGPIEFMREWRARISIARELSPRE